MKQIICIDKCETCPHMNKCVHECVREYQEFVLYIVCLVIGNLLSLLSAFMCVWWRLLFWISSSNLAQHGWTERTISPLEITGFQLHMWRNFNIYFHRFCKRRIVSDLSPSSLSRNRRREFFRSIFPIGGWMEKCFQSTPVTSVVSKRHNLLMEFSIVRLYPRLIIIYKF